MSSRSSTERLGDFFESVVSLSFLGVLLGCFGSVLVGLCFAVLCLCCFEDT